MATSFCLGEPTWQHHQVQQMLGRCLWVGLRSAFHSGAGERAGDGLATSWRAAANSVRARRASATCGPAAWPQCAPQTCACPIGSSARRGGPRPRNPTATSSRSLTRCPRPSNPGDGLGHVAAVRATASGKWRRRRPRHARGSADERRPRAGNGDVDGGLGQAAAAWTAAPTGSRQRGRAAASGRQRRRRPRSSGNADDWLERSRPQLNRAGGGHGQFMVRSLSCRIQTDND